MVVKPDDDCSTEMCLCVSVHMAGLGKGHTLVVKPDDDCSTEMCLCVSVQMAGLGGAIHWL